MWQYKSQQHRNSHIGTEIYSKHLQSPNPATKAKYLTHTPLPARNINRYSNNTTHTPLPVVNMAHTPLPVMYISTVTNTLITDIIHSSGVSTSAYDNHITSQSSNNITSQSSNNLYHI